MAYRNYAQVPPTSATIALNSFIFGYAGHSLVTPHAALKQQWWTDDRIEAKVTRNFVVSQIRGEERGFLDKPLGFGEGLTDDSYMEWILDRARRLFLVLSEVGRPEQIFGLIDDSLDDEDLPLSYENVVRLDLSLDSDDRLSQRFYDTQYLFLLRSLKEGSHFDYGINEHIPMEHVHKLPPAVTLQVWDRIHFPKDPDTIYMRRKVSFGTGDGREAVKKNMLQDIARARELRHEHIAPVWASYTYDNAGYILTDFVAEHTLHSFMAHRIPYQFQPPRVAPEERPVIILEWMHCLSDALASLHHRGSYHSAIRPSNVLIDRENRIAFADVGHLETFQKGKKGNRSEVAEYAAPELNMQPEGSRPRRAQTTDSRSGRKTSSSDDNSSNRSSSCGNSIFSTCATPTISSPVTASYGSSNTSISIRNFSRHISMQSTSSGATTSTSSYQSFAPFAPTPPLPTCNHMSPLPSVGEGVSMPATPVSPSSHSMSSPVLSNGFQSLRKMNSTTYLAPPSSSFTYYSPIPSAKPEPQPADIFALGCVFLEMLTWLLHGHTEKLRKHRHAPPPAPSFPFTPSQSPPKSSSASMYSTKSTRSIRTIKTVRSRRRASVTSGISSVVSGLTGTPGGGLPGAAATPPSFSSDARFATCACTGKLDAWLQTLQEEWTHRKVHDGPASTTATLATDDAAPPQVLDAIPPLLALTRAMLSPHPSERPDAKEVRARVEDALVRCSRIEQLCCRGRVWDEEGAEAGERYVARPKRVNRGRALRGSLGVGIGGCEHGHGVENGNGLEKGAVQVREGAVSRAGTRCESMQSGRSAGSGMKSFWPWKRKKEGLKPV